MSSDILVVGNGYIGKKVSAALSCPVSQKIIKGISDAQEEIAEYRPRVLINCVGFVGRNVDECELDKDNTLTSNSFIPLILAEACLRSKVKLVHISSGCIFHYDYAKDQPLSEERAPDYLNLFYSRSKIYSERALGPLLKEYPFLILRIRVPLDTRPDPRNLLTKLVSYKKVIDAPNSVTYIPDFLGALRHLLKIDAAGIYNVVSKNPLVYPRLMEVYKKYVPGFNYEVVDFHALKMNRTNLALSCAKLERAGFKMRDINEVLEECMREYVKY